VVRWFIPELNLNEEQHAREQVMVFGSFIAIFGAALGLLVSLVLASSEQAIESTPGLVCGALTLWALRSSRSACSRRSA